MDKVRILLEMHKKRKELEAMNIKTQHTAPQQNSQAVDMNKARAREILLRIQLLNANVPKKS